ncbi:MAG: dethiobiotin synthase [Bacteroidota bacterium]
MKNTFFITGSSTAVGKTIASAIITETLEADYWKPIQAGELDNTDTHKVARLLSNDKTRLLESAYNLTGFMSPHAAAEIDEVIISAKKIKRPATRNSLVIEGAGGLLVPINDTETIADLIKPSDKVVVVSRHYLGSINHTLLTIEALKQRKLDIFGILFSGDANPATERIIEEMSGAFILGRIDEEPYFDQNVVREYANKFKEVFEERLSK